MIVFNVILGIHCCTPEPNIYLAKSLLLSIIVFVSNIRQSGLDIELGTMTFNVVQNGIEVSFVSFPSCLEELS